jgi:hypothetical protein
MIFKACEVFRENKNHRVFLKPHRFKSGGFLTIKQQQMKQAILLVAVALLVTSSYAQKLDKAKTLFKENKLTEARTEIDNFLAVEKE